MGFFTAFAQGALNRREEVRDAEAEKQAERAKFIRETLRDAMPEVNKMRMAAAERNRRYSDAIAMGADPMRAQMYANSDMKEDELMQWGVKSKSTGQELSAESIRAMAQSTPATTGADAAISKPEELTGNKSSMMGDVFINKANDDRAFAEIAGDMGMEGGAVKALFGAVMSGDYGVRPGQAAANPDVEVYKKTGIETRLSGDTSFQNLNFRSGSDREKAAALWQKYIETSDPKYASQVYGMAIPFTEEEAIKNAGRGSEKEPKTPFTNDKQLYDTMAMSIGKVLDPDATIYNDHNGNLVIRSLDPTVEQNVAKAMSLSLESLRKAADDMGATNLYEAPVDIVIRTINEVLDKHNLRPGKELTPAEQEAKRKEEEARKNRSATDKNKDFQAQKAARGITTRGE